MSTIAPKTRWTDPGTLTGLAGLIMIVYGSYKDFQSDVTGRVGALEVRMAVLESQGTERGQRIDRLAVALERTAR